MQSITPVVNDILSTGLAGTTCVLTRTNNEASQITGLLLKNGIPAKLIQSNDSFNLYNLLEIRFFLDNLNLTEDVHTISDDIWDEAKRKLKERFGNSPNFEICTGLINDFEMTNPKNKYKSDLVLFIRESKLEDFYSTGMETIFVSTIHKAKGREFDNVFLVLDDFNIQPDDAKRQIYVAMTRAKNNLTIHYDGNYLESMTAEGLIKELVEKVYPPPDEFAMQLTHNDIWLNYSTNCQSWISQLNSGDELRINGTLCCNSKGIPVLRFSNERKKIIARIKQKNYVPKTAKIRFIVLWKGKDMEKEIRILLPELCFERAA